MTQWRLRSHPGCCRCGHRARPAPGIGVLQEVALLTPLNEIGFLREGGSRQLGSNLRLPGAPYYSPRLPKLPSGSLGTYPL